MQSSNAQLLSQQRCPKPKRHNAKLCSFAIRQRIISALANGDSIRAIARALHVSNNTVAAIREQEWQQVAARKERIAAQCELNATLAAERMTDKLRGTGDIPLNTLVPAFGVSVDKLALLRGNAPSVNIANMFCRLTRSALSAGDFTISWTLSRADSGRGTGRRTPEYD